MKEQAEINNINIRAMVMGYPVDIVTMDEALNYTEAAILSKKSYQVITINPEMIMMANKNPDLKRILQNADLLIPDGIGVVNALRMLGHKKIKQIPGIEFSQALIEKSVEKNYKLAFVGASKDVIDTMVYVFIHKYPNINIVYARDGYFKNEEAEVIEQLKNADPAIIFVAMGVPKQELWIEKNKKNFPNATMVGVGGSFDVWANKVKRAPKIFRQLGLEWFFRLITQPERFNRMFPALPLFFIKVMLDKKTTRKEY